MLKYILTAIVLVFGIIYFYGSRKMRNVEYGSEAYNRYRYVRMAGLAGVIADAIVCMIV